MQEQITRFLHAFDGNRRSHGRRDQKTGKSTTIHAEYSEKKAEDHLNGLVGLGIAPIRDDDLCTWGAIDIDIHKGKIELPPIDQEALSKQIQKSNLPLLCCRTKRGGSHLYCFVSEPVPAITMRQVLARWAADLGHAGVEIFPKQSRLATEPDGTKQKAGWINLPYFNKDETDRYCTLAGRVLTFERFLDAVDQARISPAELLERGGELFQEAPPCIRRLVADGIPAGCRNDALYNIVVYLKRAFPDTYREKARDINARFFLPPLEHEEAHRTILSASRRDYQYKCKEDVLKSRCRADECVKCKYGITEKERNTSRFEDELTFVQLVKYDTVPPRWQLRTEDGRAVSVATPELMDWRRLRELIIETHHIVVAPRKNDDWQAELAVLMKTMQVKGAPIDASPMGVVKVKLFEFLNRADLLATGDDISKREMLLVGCPVVQAIEGGKWVLFRGTDFTDFLKKAKCDEHRHPLFWVWMKTMGVTTKRVQIGGAHREVWAIQIKDEMSDKYEERNIESDF
jgi:hypothetical protein